MDVSTVNKPAVQTTPPPKRTEPVHKEATKPQQTEAKKAQPEAKPEPVVNTQGQRTGRLLNVTA